MNKNDRFVITINRQFGTGGHEIGMELAKRLGVKLIDKEILRAVAEKFGISINAAKRLEERRPSWWEDFSQFYQSFMSMNEYHFQAREITSRQLFSAQEEVMKMIAGRESCIIIGRCGFEVFKNHPNALRVFIHCPESVRVKRIMERYEVGGEEAAMMIADNDYTREVYTKSFTGKSWYDLRNYDLALDTKRFGVNGAVDFLMKFIDE